MTQPTSEPFIRCSKCKKRYRFETPFLAFDKDTMRQVEPKPAWFKDCGCGKKWEAEVVT